MTAAAPRAARSPPHLLTACRAGMECSGRDLEVSGRPAQALQLDLVEAARPGKLTGCPGGWQVPG